MDLIGSYPKHLQLLKRIDDNINAFILLKQLNTCYTLTHTNCRHLLRPTLSHTRTYMSTSTQHVTLKSPLLLQFPYCKLCSHFVASLINRLV